MGLCLLPILVHSCGFLNGTLMGLCLLAMLCCLMASTAVFNGALSARSSFVFNGDLLAKFFNGTLSSSLLHDITTEN